MRLTNERVGAISRAYFELKAAHRYISTGRFIIEPQAIDDVTCALELLEEDVSYAVEQLEEVFHWLDFDRTVRREDEDE